MDLSNAAWRTSSYSGGNGGQCVQVAAIPSDPGQLCAVRDSKDPAGSALLFGSSQWRAFTTAVKAATPSQI